MIVRVVRGVMVRHYTDSDIVPKPPWKARKQVYIDSVVTKAKASQLVSAADKLHNARAILFDHSRLGVAVFDRFSVEAAEVVWYYVLKRAWTSKLGWVSPKRHGSVIGMGVCLNGTAYTGMIDAAVPSSPLNYVQTQCSNKSITER